MSKDPIRFGRDYVMSGNKDKTKNVDKDVQKDLVEIVIDPKDLPEDVLTITDDLVMIVLPKILKTTGSCTGLDVKTGKSVKNVKTFNHEIDLAGGSIERINQILCHQIKIQHRESNELPKTSVEDIMKMDKTQRYSMQDVYANKIKKRKDPEIEMLDQFILVMKKKGIEMTREEATERYNKMKDAGFFD